MRCITKAIVCFWVRCVVLVSSAWKNAAMPLMCNMCDITCLDVWVVGQFCHCSRSCSVLFCVVRESSLLKAVWQARLLRMWLKRKVQLLPFSFSHCLLLVISMQTLDMYLFIFLCTSLPVFFSMCSTVLISSTLLLISNSSCGIFIYWLCWYWTLLFQDLNDMDPKFLQDLYTANITENAAEGVVLFDFFLPDVRFWEKKPSYACFFPWGSGGVSLAGAATSTIFIATKTRVLSRQK